MSCDENCRASFFLVFYYNVKFPYLERFVDVKHKAGRVALWMGCWKDWMSEKK